jgi:hypothetical protein
MGMLYCIVITLLAQTNNNITILCLIFGFMHRCQPLRFFRNCSGQNYGVPVNSLLVTDFRLLPARNRSPFEYHCDHLDASLSVKIV